MLRSCGPDDDARAVNVCFHAAGLYVLALALPSQSWADHTRSEPAGLVLALGDEHDHARAAEVQLLLEQALDGPLASLAAPLPLEGGDVQRERLAVLAAAEQALVQARELNARFREAAALQVLWNAEQLLLSALDIPGVHTYLAELEVQLGLCAAQLGQGGLVESALARAASLDPARRIEAAEAPPATVAVAQRIARARETAQLSEQTLEVTPPDAERWLDGERLPDGPLRARSGEHLLVVRAPGHATYATLLRLEPGARPKLKVALSPERAEAARRELLAHARDLSAASPHARHVAKLHERPVYLIQVAPARYGARSLVHRCDARSCRAALMIANGSARVLNDPREAEAWLDPPVTRRPNASHKALWQRWPVWAASAAAVAIGVTTALLLRPAPASREERVLEVQPAPLPP